MEVLSALVVAFILTFSLPGPSESSKICLPALDCMGLDFQQTLVKDDVRELCRLLPGVLTCIEDALSECGDDVDPSVGQQVEAIRSKTAACGGSGSDTVDAGTQTSTCSKAGIEKCISSELQTAYQQDDGEAVCREIPTALTCARATLDRCKDEKVTDTMKTFVTNMQKTVNSQCGGNSAPTLHAPALSTLLVVLLTYWLHRWWVQLD